VQTVSSGADRFDKNIHLFVWLTKKIKALKEQHEVQESGQSTK
jgi:hypothetical protein